MSIMKQGNIKSFGAAAGVMKSCAINWKKLTPQEKEEWKTKNV